MVTVLSSVAETTSSSLTSSSRLSASAAKLKLLKLRSAIVT